MPNEKHKSDGVKKTKAQGRSPAYPVFSLGEAITRIKKLWESLRKQQGHLDSVLSAVGYSTRHGAAMRALAALNHYGLTDETGTGDNRRISISERGQDIIHLPESDPRRIDAIKAAALSPAIHSDLWNRYGKSLPGDDPLRAYLIRDKGYNESAAGDVIKNYRETFDLAKLSDLSEDSRSADGPNYQPPANNLGRGNSPMNSPGTQELPILVGEGRIAKIPFPMSNDDFELLIETLELWKKKLTAQPQKEPDVSKE